MPYGFFFFITLHVLKPLPHKWIYTDIMQKDQVFTGDAAAPRVKCGLDLAMCSNITKQCEVRMKALFGPKENLSRQNVITWLGLKPEWQG